MTAVAQPSVDVLFRQSVPINICDSLGRLTQQSGNSVDSKSRGSDINDLRDYRLTVSGLCSRTHQFDLNSLRDFFEPRQFHGNAFSTGLRTWTGCSMRDVLEFVGSSGQATDLLLAGAHIGESGNPYEHSAVLMPLDMALDDKILLAWSVDGRAIARTRQNSDTYQGPIDAIINTDMHTHRVVSLSRIMLASFPA
jgi:DMSO/TMAO reductase YedYZ molybdopterin-dependent catalytic subunit